MFSAALAAFTCSLAGCVAAPEPTIDDAFPVLQRDRTARDEVTGATADEVGYVSSSSRFLASHDGDTVWIATSSTGGVCIVIVGAETTTGCGGPPIAGAGMLQTSVEVVGSPEYRLLTRGDPKTPVEGFTQLTENLWVDNS